MRLCLKDITKCYISISINYENGVLKFISRVVEWINGKISKRNVLWCFFLRPIVAEIFTIIGASQSDGQWTRAHAPPTCAINGLALRETVNISASVRRRKKCPGTFSFGTSRLIERHPSNTDSGYTLCTRVYLYVGETRALAVKRIKSFWRLSLRKISGRWRFLPSSWCRRGSSPGVGGRNYPCVQMENAPFSHTIKFVVGDQAFLRKPFTLPHLSTTSLLQPPLPYFLASARCAIELVRTAVSRELRAGRRRCSSLVSSYTPK